MRIIKFRFYDSLGKIWEYWTPEDEISEYIGEKTAWQLLNNEYYKYPCQFTGLLDKNCKEIYEGDIVKHRKLNRPEDMIMYGIVEQLSKDKPNEVKYEGCGFTPLAGWTDIAIKDMEWEIIGNIYENPELLTK